MRFTNITLNFIIKTEKVEEICKALSMVLVIFNIGSWSYTHKHDV